MNKDIPLYKGKGLFGMSTDFLKNVAQFTHEKEADIGDFYRVKLFVPLFATFRPDVIKHVLQTNAKNYRKSRAYDQLKLALGNGLVTSEGHFWRRQRRMAQPAFYKTHLEELFAEMSKVTDKYVLDLKKRVAQKQVIEIDKEMMQVTADIVLRTLFSSDNPNETDATHKMMAEMQEYVIQRVHKPFFIPLQYINGNHRKFVKYRASFNEKIFKLIEERRQMKTRPNDLLSMFLDAKDAETGEGMTDEQLRDEAITIFSAGHETSANALAWTLDLLARHPKVVERLRTEEVEVLDGKTPTFADLRQLQYHQQVIEEGMRLYPPAHAVGREAIAEDEIDGVTIPKNSVVFISIFALHRSPKYWKNPLQFDPDRFSPEEKKQRPRLTYLPFGAGARMCIGNHFAMMEMQLLLARLIRHFDFEALSDRPVDFIPLITLRPKSAIPLICKPRTQLETVI
ncbi:MAG: cytochrome P450 [Bacteroidota bacterium]